VAPVVGDRVLEVGAGTGTFTRYLRNHSLVVATDNDPHALERLRARFRQHDAIRVEAVDWSRPDLGGLRGEQFDTVLCLDGLASLERDDEALAAFASLLGPGGRLVLQAPAMHRLYGETDCAVGHLRRYERDELIAKLRRQGFAVESARYVNLPGLLVWYANACLLRRRSVPSLQTRIASTLVAWLRLEDHFDLGAGMTLLAIGRKE
jgi:SAM-dependent methyltransferase